MPPALADGLRGRTDGWYALVWGHGVCSCDDSWQGRGLIIELERRPGCESKRFHHGSEDEQAINL